MTNLLTTLATAHVVQAVIIGAVLAFLTAIVILNAKIKAIQTTVNGWSSTLVCARPENDLLTRAASAKFLPGVNIAEEAMYWVTTVDGEGRALDSRHDYRMHFAAGQLPPNEAFWSLTITDTQGYMVGSAGQRHSVGDRSGLAPNPDGSTDIYLQAAAPAAHESNWLPALAGRFKLTLRAYLPGQAILKGEYQVPPVVKVR